MTKINPRIEACSCPVCRSDMAYIAPCMKKVDNRRQKRYNNG